MPSYPLHEAARDGDLAATLRCLAQPGADVNALNKRGNTALMQAAEKGRPEVVQALLDANADPTLTNPRRLTAREVALRHAGGRRAADAAIARLLESAEAAAQQANAAARAAPGLKQTDNSGTGASTKRATILCSVCGALVRPRQKVDFLMRSGDHTRSRHVHEFIHSHALGVMRTHPDHHYHNLLEMRRLTKEASESWGVLSAARSMLVELAVEPSQVVFFDLCSGKGLTAVALALTFPEAEVLALDIISDKCLPHTHDVSNLRYVEANLFRSEGMLRTALQEPRQRIGVLIGSHLCGRLSVQAVELFRGIADMRALVLSPCCWPRHRDYNSDLELEELAVLLMKKARESDTYSTWARYLLAKVTGRLEPNPALKPAADVTAATDGPPGALWSGNGRLMQGPRDTLPWVKMPRSLMSVTTASTLGNAQAPVPDKMNGHSNKPRQLPRRGQAPPSPDDPASLVDAGILCNANGIGAPLSSKQLAAIADAQVALANVSVGLYHDHDILSEKDYVLVAVKPEPQQFWTNAGRYRHRVGVQERYVRGQAGKSIGASESYSALCEVWGMQRPPAPSGKRPQPPLKGSTKPFRELAKKSHHRASRILVEYCTQLGLPASALANPNGLLPTSQWLGRRPPPEIAARIDAKRLSNSNTMR